MNNEQEHSLEPAALDDAQVDQLLDEAEEHASAPPDPFAQAMLLQTIGLLVVTAGHLEGGLCRAIRWLRHQPAASHDRDVERMGWQELLSTIETLAGKSADGRRVAECSMSTGRRS